MFNLERGASPKKLEQENANLKSHLQTKMKKLHQQRHFRRSNTSSEMKFRKDFGAPTRCFLLFLNSGNDLPRLILFSLLLYPKFIWAQTGSLLSEFLPVKTNFSTNSTNGSWSAIRTPATFCDFVDTFCSKVHISAQFSQNVSHTLSGVSYWANSKCAVKFLISCRAKSKRIITARVWRSLGLDLELFMPSFASILVWKFYKKPDLFKLSQNQF